MKTSLKLLAFLFTPIIFIVTGFDAANAGDRAESTLRVHIPEGPLQALSPAYLGMVTPAQIRHAYNFDQISGTGAGQTIGIVVAYGNPNAQSDFDVFNRTFALPSQKLMIVYPQGKPSSVDETWALETNLDTEWAHAIAPGANLLVVVAPNNDWPNLLAAVDYAVNQGAKQISMSWGEPEFSSETYYDFHFNHPGVAFFAAAGDTGTGAEYPAVSPCVTGVGGSSLQLDAKGNLLQPETVWSNSGGGISAYERNNNGFQNNWKNPNPGHRMVPDVSYSAEPASGFAVYDSYGYMGVNGWIQVGGTSAGAPQWAALMAIGNQARRQSVGHINSALYAIGTPTSQSLFFTDIVSGCNSPTPSAVTCAAPGYDTVSGLGTPHAGTLIPQIVNSPY